MDFQYNNNQCVNLNSINDTVIWANNSTNNTIAVQPVVYQPLITYGEQLKETGNTSILYYQYCGPLIVLLKHFAKYINANLKIGPHPRDISETWFESGAMDSSKEGIHIFLYPYCPLTFSEEIRISIGGTLSRSIGSLERGSLISATKKEEWSLFSLFSSFDMNIYYSLIIFTLLIALLLNAKSGSISKFLRYVWDLWSIILSDIIARRISNSFARLLIGLWLLASIVLLSTFSGRLFEILVRKDPIDRIDSWNDLYTKSYWKQSKIYVIKYFEMYDFIESNSSDMALDFGRRAEYLEPLKFLFNNKLVEDTIKSIRKYNSVTSYESLIFHYYKVKFEGIVYSDLTEGFDFHISESGFGTKPYFLVINPHVKEIINPKLDYVITQLSESGIYEHEVRKSLKPKGYGPDINTKVDVSAYEFGPLTLKQLKGAFIVLFIGLSIAFLVFLMELFTNSYSDTIHNLITEVLTNSRIISYLLEIYYLYIRRNRVNPLM